MPCVSGDILGLGDALCLRGYLRVGGCLVSLGVCRAWGMPCVSGICRAWGMPCVSGICRAWGMPCVLGICRAWRIPRGSEDALKGFVRKPIQMSYVFQLHCCTRQFGGTILQ